MQNIIDKTHMGINVRNTNIPFADLIVDGIKTIETRDKPSLSSYVGKRVAIVRTGAGVAKAIGEATIVAVEHVKDSEAFRQLEGKHYVPEGNVFDIKEGGKYLYYIKDAVRWAVPKSVGHGIISRAVFTS